MTANKLEGKARELLAREFEESGEVDIANDLRDGAEFGGFPGIALRATTRALDTARQSEGMVLVPASYVEAVTDMASWLKSWRDLSLRVGKEAADASGAIDALLAAAPADAGEGNGNG